MLSEVLLEFDMRIKTGEKEDDDLQLIDGLTNLGMLMLSRPFTLAFSGSCGGAVDICLILMHQGMEALIEVVISEVHSAFDLSPSSFVSLQRKRSIKKFKFFMARVDACSGQHQIRTRTHLARVG